MADVPPLPKKKPVLDLKKDLRPISLKPCVSRVAKEFVVEDVVKPAVLDMIRGNQYGAIPKSSTTMALVEQVHAQLRKRNYGHHGCKDGSNAKQFCAWL